MSRGSIYDYIFGTSSVHDVQEWVGIYQSCAAAYNDNKIRLHGIDSCLGLIRCHGVVNEMEINFKSNNMCQLKFRFFY